MRIRIGFRTRRGGMLCCYPRGHTRTDSLGRYEVKAPGLARWYEIHCTPSDSHVPPPDQNIYRHNDAWAEARLRLASAAWIEGLVVRGDGTGVHGCAVRAEWSVSDAFGCSVATDATGRFRLPVPEDVLAVTVAVDALRTIRHPFLPPGLRKDDGPRGDAALSDARVHGVVPGARLRVVLPESDITIVKLLAPNGTPLRGGLVKIVDESDGSTVRRSRMRTGSTCKFERVATGPYRVECHPSDENLAPAVVRVRLPSPAPVVLRCPEGAVVSGLVLAEDASGFVVTWLGRKNVFDPYREAVGCRQKTTKGNRFILRGLTPEPAALFLHRDGDPRHAFVPNVMPGTRSLAVRLETGLAIEGVIRGRDAGRHDFVRATRGLLRVQAAIAENNSFKIRGLPPGCYRVELEDGVGRDGVPAGTTGVSLDAR